MKKIVFSLIAFGCLFALPSHALTPPWSQEALEKESELIVIGVVGSPVECLGFTGRNACYDGLKFSVPMTVKKPLKGPVQSRETLKITFYYYDYTKSNCAGDQAAILHSGDEGTYYLKKLVDGTYSPVHWSGAQVKVRGTGALPKCP